jgi:hypothetical protein
MQSSMLMYWGVSEDTICMEKDEGRLASDLKLSIYFIVGGYTHYLIVNFYTHVLTRVVMWRSAHAQAKLKIPECSVVGVEVR